MGSVGGGMFCGAFWKLMLSRVSLELKIARPSFKALQKGFAKDADLKALS
jgi:hypothetical protein